MENIFEQITNISKASAYDILVNQVTELKEENECLKNDLDNLNNNLDDWKKEAEDWKQLTMNYKKLAEKNQEIINLLKKSNHE